MNGIPSTGCSVGVKSTVDWIGIDNYTWTTKQQLLSAYSTLDPQNKFRWVAVPVSTYDVANSDVMLSMYKEIAEIDNNFIYIMNFRYDSRVTGGGSDLDILSDHLVNTSYISESRLTNNL